MNWVSISIEPNDYLYGRAITISVKYPYTDLNIIKEMLTEYAASDQFKRAYIRKAIDEIENESDQKCLNKLITGIKNSRMSETEKAHWLGIISETLCEIEREMKPK